MSGKCVISLVLSHCSKNLKQWTSVRAQFYSASKRKYILEVWGQASPKEVKRREASGLILLPFLYVFLLPLSLSDVNWASLEGCLLHLRFSLRFLVLPLFCFSGLFPFFVFLPSLFWTPFSSSNYLTYMYPEYIENDYNSMINFPKKNALDDKWTLKHTFTVLFETT